jgi:hypothetical protein
MKKIQENGLDIGLESHQFQMKASAKAFSILSSGLYSNKVQAVIRELSCNAYDAQVEAGNADLPFDVKLPDNNYGKDTFYVRDYGTGLTEEQIYNVYTTYFESTKTESNDYVGALGLGSKSPFCLTDSFTVESFVDGKLLTFLAFIGKEGMPEISKVGEAETTESNGLKVSFETDAGPGKFRREARNLFKWFPVVPNFITNEELAVETVEPLRTLSDTVKVYPGNVFGYDERILVKQGTVVYPIPESIMRQHFAEFEYLSSMRLVIEVDLGQVDITASRESLSFVEMTVTNMKAKFQEIDTLVRGAITEELDVQEGNIWKLTEATERLGHIYPSSLIWEHEIVRSHPQYDSNDFRLPETEYLNKKSETVTIKKYSTWSNRIKGGSGKEYPFHSTFGKEVTVKAKTNTVFMVNDTTRGPLNVAREYLKKNTVSQLIVIDYVNRRNYSKRVVNRILKEFENPTNVVFVSDLPKPTRMTTKIDPKEIRIRQANNMDVQYWDADWTTRSYNEERDGDAYFVNLERSTIVDGDFDGKIDEMKRIVENVFPNFYNKVKVCGIPKAQKHKLAKAGIELNSFIDLLKEKVAEITVNDIRIKSFIDLPDWADTGEFKKAFENGDITEPRVVEMMTRYTLSSAKSKNGVSKRYLKNLALRFGIELAPEVKNFLDKDPEATEDYRANVTAIEESFPMVKFHRAGWNTDDATKALVDYLNG